LLRRRPSLTGALLGAGLLVFAGATLAEPQREQALRWLERMSRAMEELNYRGTLVRVRDGDVRTLAVVHKHGPGGVRERIYAVDGERREVLRDGERVRCLYPEQGSARFYPGVSGRLFSRMPSNQLLRRNRAYRFTIGPERRVAGHGARQINIRPTDRMRYGYELWLEQRTGMLLEQIVFDHDNQAIERLRFTEIELGAEIDESQLQPQAPLEEFVTVSESLPVGADRSHSGVPRWQPQEIPEGFVLLNHKRADGARFFEHLVYSDGLAGISVFIEELGRERSGPAVDRASVGTLNVYLRRTEAVLITALGNVPYATLSRIGAGVYDNRRVGRRTAEQ